MSKNEAVQTMAESLDSLVELKIKIPLSSKTKNIHTNTWIYYEPIEFGDKIEDIYGQMKSLCKQFRYTFYRKNYWYVKAVSIKYSDNTMELTLSPMPTPYGEEKLDNGSKKTTTKTSKTNETSTKTNAPTWLNKTDKEWAEDFVAKHTRGVTDELQKAKKIYNGFKKGYAYEGYKNLRHTTPKGNRKKAFQRGRGNCADGANILETLYLVAGINARIKHAPNHYLVKLKINGKIYWVDNHSRSATWNKVWRGITSNNEGNITNGEYIDG